MNKLTNCILAFTITTILGMCTVKFPQLLAFELSALLASVLYLVYKEVYRGPPTFNLTVERVEASAQLPAPPLSMTPSPPPPLNKYDLALQRQKEKKDGKGI